MTENIIVDEKYHERVSNIKEALSRHTAFWERDETDRPLLRIYDEEHWKPYESYVDVNGEELTGKYEIKRGLFDHRRTLQPYLPSGAVLSQDMLKGCGAYDLCYTELILGCRVFRTGPSVSPSSFLQSWSDVDKMNWNGFSPWFDEIASIIAVLKEELGNNYPITQPLFRGPFDMAEAAVPTEMLFTGFYEEPERIRKLLSLCTDIFIDTVKFWYSNTPDFHGGHVIRDMSGLWAPGIPVMFQEDAMKNISKDMYFEFIKDQDERISENFDYPIIHTHSGSHHIYPVLAEEKKLKAVEIAIDPPPFGPDLEDFISDLMMLQAAGKALLIEGEITEGQINSLLNNLEHNGLALNVRLLVSQMS
ncbi:hypothetical protein GF340_01420 [Candidatus Peregrinibacteria bacterium]|nr:hypothetical protein [Candidatus Peregrinibacteria bacterium]